MADRAEPENPQGLIDGQATPDPASVIISYSSPDASVATAAVEVLERNGLTCWIAPRDVRAGALYADAIIRAISDARALVLVLTASSIESSQCAEGNRACFFQETSHHCIANRCGSVDPGVRVFLE